MRTEEEVQSRNGNTSIRAEQIQYDPRRPTPFERVAVRGRVNGGNERFAVARTNDPRQSLSNSIVANNLTLNQAQQMINQAYIQNPNQ